MGVKEGELEVDLLVNGYSQTWNQERTEARIRSILYPSKLNETEIQVLALYVDPSWMAYDAGLRSRVKTRLEVLLDWLSETSRICSSEYSQLLRLGRECRESYIRRKENEENEKTFSPTAVDGSRRTDCAGDEIRV